MSLSTFTFIPELNYWIKLIVDRSPCQQKYSKIPVQVSESEWRCSGSILDLLFNLTFADSSYSIFYRKASVSKISDRELLHRIPIYANRLEIYSCEIEDYMNVDIPDSEIGTSTEVIEDIPASQLTGTGNIFDTSILTAFNIFSITEGEKQMLDILLLYKTGNPITISNIVYQDLPSSLSKLIYIFLVGEIDNDYSLFIEETPISNQNRLLEIIYEKWLLDHVYKKQSLEAEAPTQENFVESEFTNIQRAFTVDEINSSQLEFPEDTLPMSASSIYLVYNGQIQILDTDYTYKLIDDDSSLVGLLDWSGLALKQKATVGDRFYLAWSYAMEE